MTDNKYKGIVKNISMKTKGVLILNKDGSEEWWNPLGDKVKAIITPELKGNEVELTIINQEKRSFSYLSVLKQNVTIGSGGNTEAKGELSRERIIVRQNALSHASAFVETIRQTGISSPDALKEIFFNFANECEKWVWRK